MSFEVSQTAMGVLPVPPIVMPPMEMTGLGSDLAFLPSRAKDPQMSEMGQSNAVANKLRGVVGTASK